MGSKNDYPIMKKCEQILKKFDVKNDVLIVSAHRTPNRLFKFAKNAHKNYSVICAGAGRAAHLAGMCASLTKIPVIGVPIKDKKTGGVYANSKSNDQKGRKNVLVFAEKDDGDDDDIMCLNRNGSIREGQAECG